MGKLFKAIGDLFKAPADAVQVAPATSPAWRTRGNEALARGDIEEAHRCYIAAVQADPGDPLAHLNLGFVQMEKGEQEAAMASLARSLSLGGEGAGHRCDAHYLLALAERSRGNLDAALGHAESALAIQAGFVPALGERAELLAALGRHDEALVAAERWYAAAPSPEAAQRVAHELYTLQRPAEALALLDVVIAGEPSKASALAARGHVLLKLNRPEEAVVAFRRAMDSGDKSAGTLAALGGAFQRSGRPSEAVQALQDAIAREPGHADALCNMVHVLTEQLKVREAIVLAEEGLARAPRDADLHWNLGIARLLAGDLPAGFLDYEWRWHRGPDAPPLPVPGVPRWEGQPLAGRRLLVFSEQGFGDTIQFLRFLPWAAAQGGAVVLRVPSALQELARGYLPSLPMAGTQEALPPLDFQCALESLPQLAGTSLATIPAPVPYLHADGEKAQAWANRLASDAPQLRVGITWSGNPAHTNDRNRSIPLAQFRRLETAGCRFVSLQPQVRASDEAAFAQWTALTRAGDGLKDFSETAALVASLDLIISVDTSVVHLAGAMGKRVWTLLPHCPDWRWMLERRDTPWYPTMELFRQPRPYDWAPVLDEVAGRLRAEVS